MFICLKYLLNFSKYIIYVYLMVFAVNLFKFCLEMYFHRSECFQASGNALWRHICYGVLSIKHSAHHLRLQEVKELKCIDLSCWIAKGVLEKIVRLSTVKIWEILLRMWHITSTQAPILTIRIDTSSECLADCMYLPWQILVNHILLNNFDSAMARVLVAPWKLGKRYV